MTYLTGSSCSSNQETELQEQIDLARWEGEGGVPARHVHRATPHAKSRRVAATSATYRVREPIPSN